MITIYFNEHPMKFEKNPSLMEALNFVMPAEAGNQKDFVQDWMSAFAGMTCTCNFAVAINRKFIPKTNYAGTILNDNDIVEIISPMQGG